MSKFILALLLLVANEAASGTPLKLEITNVSGCAAALADSSLLDQINRITSHAKIVAALERLGKVYRSGWQRRKIPNNLGETVLQHSVKVFHAAMSYPSHLHHLDQNRMALMSLFHDIAEHIVPDFTPHDNISNEEKHALEKRAIVELIKDAGADGDLILSLWEEYESQNTAESKIVFQLDKLDAAIQAFEYKKMGFSVSDFFSYTESKLTDPLLIAILRDLQKMPNSTKAYDYYFRQLSSAH